jgi:predicted amidophosphoribosyltransferase
MKRFKATPSRKVVFGDDRSDFEEEAHHGVLSLGNPWTSTRAPVAPDVAWFDVSSLVEQGAWHMRLRYVGEAKLHDVEWHRGSLLPFDVDAYTLGRYFPTKHRRHHDALSQLILSGKQDRSGNPRLLSILECVVERLAKRIDIDVVLSVPAHRHQGKEDRFSAYRKLVADVSGASEDPVATEILQMPSSYKSRSHDARRKLRQGSLAIEEDLDGLTVLLIDDVVTSGATLLALKDAANQAGAERVIQLAFGFSQSVR